MIWRQKPLDIIKVRGGKRLLGEHIPSWLKEEYLLNYTDYATTGDYLIVIPTVRSYLQNLCTFMRTLHSHI